MLINMYVYEEDLKGTKSNWRKRAARRKLCRARRQDNQEREREREREGGRLILARIEPWTML